MEPDMDQIAEQVTNICHAAIATGTQANLTRREIIKELLEAFPLEDDSFFQEKAVKALIKETARAALQHFVHLEAKPDPTDDQIDSGQRPDPPKRVMVEATPRSKSKSAKVPESEDEAAEELESEPQVITTEDSLAKPSPKSANSRASTKRPQKSEKKSTVKSAEFLDSDGEPVSMPPSVEQIARKPKRKSGADDHDSASAPKQAKGKSDSGPSKKSLSAEDKHAEEIKRLKSYVAACGVRKRWTNEFANCPTPQRQIQHLKSILTDLGMPGRCSMVKAKEIRSNRELADELNELQSSIGNDEGSRKKRSKMVISSEEDESDSGPAQEGAPKPKRNPFAFLGNNSGDDSD